MHITWLRHIKHSQELWAIKAFCAHFVGKDSPTQLLITRGALTTFSIANDVAKYFAIFRLLFP
jgi:hypothetical protein